MTDKQLTAGERLALLKKEHGDLDAVKKAVHNFTYIVYDSEGTIYYKGITEPDLSEYNDCKVYKFKSQEVSMIDQGGKSISQFVVVEDEHDVCHIELRKLEDVKIKSDRDFLYEVESSTATDYDIKISYNKTEWIISLAEPKKLVNNLSFYITPEKDPHILYERFVVSPSMFKNDTDTVCIDRKETDISEFSIYTHKILKKYVRS